MELASTLVLFEKHIKTLVILSALLRDEMAEFLIRLAETDYQAAINAFKDAKKSSDPSREIIMGITCLRQSYQKFYALSFGRNK